MTFFWKNLSRFDFREIGCENDHLVGSLQKLDHHGRESPLAGHEEGLVVGSSCWCQDHSFLGAHRQVGIGHRWNR